MKLHYQLLHMRDRNPLLHQGAHGSVHGNLPVPALLGTIRSEAIGTTNSVNNDEERIVRFIPRLPASGGLRARFEGEVQHT